MNDLIPTTPAQSMTLAEMKEIASIFITSRLFKNVENVAQAFVKIKAGTEYGFGPFASMQSLNIIQGKVEMTADAQASKLKASGKYDYQVKTLTDQECELAFYRLPERVEIGVSRFTMEDARKADLLKNSVWRSYPRNMLFARALTNGVAWHCPDAMACRTYGEGEISGADVVSLSPAEIVDRTTGEISPKPLPEPPKTLKDKLEEARARFEQPAPPADVAHYADGTVKHPMDDEDDKDDQPRYHDPVPPPPSPAAEPLRNLFGNPVEPPTVKSREEMLHEQLVIEARSLARQLSHLTKRDADVLAMLLKAAFGELPEKLASFDTWLQTRNTNALVDGVELLRQKVNEMRKA